MARAETNKLYRTFVKGLITEAGPLTYPEDASIAEDNCVIYRRGNRSRRLGIDTEQFGAANTGTVTISSWNSQAIKEYRWNSVANDANLSFLVVQIGTTLHFFNLSGDTILEGEMIGKIDIQAQGYVVAGAVNPEDTELSFASGKGLLFVVGKKCEPFYIEYNTSTESLSASRIYIQIRDFKGVADGLANDEEPGSLSDAHHYNLLNQGWLDAANDGTGSSVSYFNIFGNSDTVTQAPQTPIDDYFTSVSRYPGNNKQWWVAKDTTTGAFDPSLLTKAYFGTSLAPRGHYIVNAFHIDRTAVSGVSNIPVENITERPTSVAFANSRVWYALNSTVYFSQVLTDKSKAGMCYQEADPTSEVISDLIATDGGVIPIPDMAKAVRLMPLGSGIVVFGTNGVWFIGGTSAGFTATDISVSEVSDIGTTAPNSIVKVVDQIFWWSETGIQAMQQKQGLFGNVDGVFDKQNISEQTIQTFYNDIPKSGRDRAKGVYDPETNVIQWLYWDEEPAMKYEYNKLLNLDLTLQAFYPWSINKNLGDPIVVGITTTPILAGYTGPADITVRNTYLKYICVVADNPYYRLTFAVFNNIDFVDWATRTDGSTYLSYVETGYELLEDAMRKKQTPWVQTYFKRTEENYVLTGEDYVPDRQSSCFFQVKWDWSSSNKSGKYSTKREAYRLTRLPVFSEDDLVFDTGYPIVATKHKVRGSGRAIQFRFESDQRSRDFDLLGWQAFFTGNTKP